MEQSEPAGGGRVVLEETLGGESSPVVAFKVQKSCPQYLTYELYFLCHLYSSIALLDNSTFILSKKQSVDVLMIRYSPC